MKNLGETREGIIGKKVSQYKSEDKKKSLEMHRKSFDRSTGIVVS